MIGELRRRFGLAFPRVVHYRSAGGDTYFAGVHRRAVGFARAFFEGELEEVRSGREWHGRVGAKFADAAAGGAFCVARGIDGSLSERDRARAIPVPAVVNQDIHVADAMEELNKPHRKSMLRDDLRRIRKEPFTFRIETSEEILRTFYDSFYLPHVTSRFNTDALCDPFEKLVPWLSKGGELICVDHDGEWVGATFNVVHPNRYVLGWLGLRDADPRIFGLRTIPALYAHSIRRADEMGLEAIGLGKALPFLGSGLVRFKAKWRAAISLDPIIDASCWTWMDLRHGHVRDFLAREPVIVNCGGHASAVRFLPPGPEAVAFARRDVTRFQGIEQWFVLGAPEVMAAAAPVFESISEIQGIAVEDSSAEPLWLGDVLGGRKGV